MLDNLRHIKRMLMPGFAMLATMLTGCIDDASLCPPSGDPNPDEGVTFEFKVITRDAMRLGTRSLQLPDGFNPLIGTMAENYLDLENTTFMMFDKDQTLIKVFRPYVTPDEESLYVKYSVRAFLSPSEFETLTGGNSSGNVDFSIAVVGNYSKLNPTNVGYHVGMKLEDIFNDKNTVATFTMPISNNGGGYWIPSIASSNYTDAFNQQIAVTSAQIPMAGIQSYRARIEDLIASTVDNPYNLSANPDGSKDINMLRALAKIEIIDHVEVEGEGATAVIPDNRISIEKVELIGHTSRGSLLPNFAQWNRGGVETQYVTAPSVSQNVQYIGVQPEADLTTPNAPAGSIVRFFADTQATALRDDKCRVFSCYLTEYAPADRNGAYEMWIRVTARYPYVDENSKSDTSLFRVEVAPYTDAGVGAIMDILRNNIYRYQINKITPPDQNNEIVYTVCPLGVYTTDVPDFQ